MSGPRRVRAVRADERRWLAEHLQLAWGSTTIVSRGRARDASRLRAVVCTDGEELLALATFEIAAGECELVTIEAFRPREGVGSALLEAVIDQARAGGCARLHLVTTNDNLAAQRFYEHHGLSKRAVHVGAVDRAREIKPNIPLRSDDGTPIHDELEYELRLTWQPTPPRTRRPTKHPGAQHPTSRCPPTARASTHTPPPKRAPNPARRSSWPRSGHETEDPRRFS